MKLGSETQRKDGFFPIWAHSWKPGIWAVFPGLCMAWKSRRGQLGEIRKNKIQIRQKEPYREKEDSRDFHRPLNPDHGGCKNMLPNLLIWWEKLPNFAPTVALWIHQHVSSKASFPWAFPWLWLCIAVLKCRRIPVRHKTPQPGDFNWRLTCPRCSRSFTTVQASSCTILLPPPNLRKCQR